MIQYMSARQAAEKWNISQRRVSVLCAENRIPEAAMLGNMWIIPIDATKPDDARKNNGAKMKENARPFVKWAGGKGQLVDVLKMSLPIGFGKTITKYAEPFVGGGAFLFTILNEYELQEVYISDNNKELINVYEIIKRDVVLLVNSLQLLQVEYDMCNMDEKEQYYYHKRELFNNMSLCKETKIEKAALFIFLNKTCFNGLYRVNKKGKFNVPFGKQSTPTICDQDNLLKISRKLQNVSINACDYHNVIDFADDSTLVYFDPPYRPLNATSAFTSYTENQFNDNDQIELANFYKTLSSKGAKLMLSNSDPQNVNPNDKFFEELYWDFEIHHIKAYRMINSKGSSRGAIQELLITNYKECIK
ncbi:MAG: Dam family site-specific DNA-(adenine-N6)-methyltransferase [Clostridia bacterium]|nr:Dam family site-specific DNA-(adenine-N6)-methyltransferase [Clostridia bacterium]